MSTARSKAKPPRVARWEQHTEIPLLLLAVAFLVAYAWPIVDPRLDSDIATFLQLVSWTVWAAFLVDFGVRLWLADERRGYAARHWYDIALIAVPLLRPLRVLRMLAFARLINRSAVGGLAGRIGVYAAGAAVTAVVLGSLAVLDAERGDPHANITSMGDAIWWACTTVTTVGYGDRYPVTTEGRFVAVGLMVVGMGLVGAVTASLATWMVSSLGTGARD